jgi:hypothetical protein
MSYSPGSGEVLLSVGSGQYVAPEASVASSFYLQNPATGTTVAVDPLTAAEAFGAERAWSLLHQFFTKLSVQNDSVPWRQAAVAAADAVNAQTALAGLGQFAGTVLGAWLGVANPVAIATSFAQFAASTSDTESTVLFGVVGVNDATSLLSQAAGEFATLNQGYQDGAALSVSDIQNCIDDTLVALHMGQAMVTALSSVAGFDDSLLQEVVMVVNDFASGFAGALDPLFSQPLTVAGDLDTAVGALQDWQDLVQGVVGVAQADAIQYAPLTGAGLTASETALVGNPSVNPNLTSNPPPTDTGPPASDAVDYANLIVTSQVQLASPIDNFGLVEALGAGSLSLGAGGDNAGTIEADGGIITLSGVLFNPGVLEAVADGTL